VLTQVEEGSAHELAFSMLLSMALLPAAQQHVANTGEVAAVVQVSVCGPWVLLNSSFQCVGALQHLQNLRAC
jgi:hypothetical protein